MKNLTEVMEYLNSIDNINKGGCGISALAIYRWLSKNKQLSKTKFICLNKDITTHENNQQCLSDTSLDLIPCSHVMLSYNGILLDSNGFDEFDYNPYKYKLKVTTQKYMVRMVNNVGEWKTDFNRESNIPKIEHSLNIDLSDINIYE